MRMERKKLAKSALKIIFICSFVFCDSKPIRTYLFFFMFVRHELTYLLKDTPRSEKKYSKAESLFIFNIYSQVFIHKNLIN